MSCYLEPLPGKYPNYFYKYISFEKEMFIENILRQNRLYFSLPEQFCLNDAYDCRAYEFIFKNKADRELYIKEEIKEKYPNLPREERRKMLKANIRKFRNPRSNFYKERIENVNKVFKEGLNKARIAILCVTDSPYRKDMWKAYVPKMQGVCIKLNGPYMVEHLAKTEISSHDLNPHLNWLRDVKYVETPLKLSWSEYMKAEPLSAGITTLYTKLSDYSFEQEWRFVILECIEQSIKFPEEIVEEVFVAPKTNTEQIGKVEEWNSFRKVPFKITKAVLK